MGDGGVLAAAVRAVERKIAFVDLVSQLRLKQDFSRALTHSCFSTVALTSVRNTRAVVGGRGSDGLQFKFTLVFL